MYFPIPLFVPIVCTYIISQTCESSELYMCHSLNEWVIWYVSWVDKFISKCNPCYCILVLYTVTQWHNAIDISRITQRHPFTTLDKSSYQPITYTHPSQLNSIHNTEYKPVIQIQTIHVTAYTYSWFLLWHPGLD